MPIIGYGKLPGCLNCQGCVYSVNLANNKLILEMFNWKGLFGKKSDVKISIFGLFPNN